VFGHLFESDAILLPKGLGSSDPTALFRICNQISECQGDVVLDAQDLVFVDPLGMATLRALFETQLLHKNISIRWLGNQITSYLHRMDFFADLEIQGVDLPNDRARNDLPGTLLEITKVSEHAQAENIASRLALAITGKLTRSDPDAPVNHATGKNEFDLYRVPIEYSLKELLENSLTHARRNGRGDAAVWVACQYFPKTKSVRMAIVDNGCGFLSTLEHHPKLTEPTDSAAIKAALLPRVSCNRGPLASYDRDSENQGVGLTTTARIAEAADGYLIVASGNAWLETKRSGEDSSPDSRWNGVAIAFVCSREKLPDVSVPKLLPVEEHDIDEELDFG